MLLVYEHISFKGHIFSNSYSILGHQPLRSLTFTVLRNPRCTFSTSADNRQEIFSYHLLYKLLTLSFFIIKFLSELNNIFHMKDIKKKYFLFQIN